MNIDISDLAKEIVDQLHPRIPYDEKLWDVGTIAEYLDMSESQVRQRIICNPSFPNPIRIPTTNGRSEESRAHPRWEAKEVKAYVMKCR